jgi:hypothetical protein
MEEYSDIHAIRYPVIQKRIALFTPKCIEHPRRYIRKKTKT